jgi:hypothetical protein
MTLIKLIRYVGTKPTGKSTDENSYTKNRYQKMGSCEHGNEPLVTIQGWEVSDHLSEY